MDQLARPSKKQRELLSFIDGFIKGYGYGPSYREIMRALNYKSVSTVATHVDGLITKGFLAKKDNSARSLVVVDSGETPLIVKPITKTQQKWLVDQVKQRIESYKDQPSQQLYDEITVLIHSLKILGFDEAVLSVTKAYNVLQPVG